MTFAEGCNPAYAGGVRVVSEAKRATALDACEVIARRDVPARMGFRPQAAPDGREMDAAFFTDAPLGLGQRSRLTLDERVDYDAADDLVFINLEGLTLETLEQAVPAPQARPGVR